MTEAICKPPSVETREDLEAVLAEQNTAILEMGRLVRAMDQKLRTYVALVDIHEAALERVGIMPVRKAGPLAN
jgi:hypothetical protein